MLIRGCILPSLIITIDGSDFRSMSFACRRRLMANQGEQELNAGSPTGFRSSGTWHRKEPSHSPRVRADPESDRKAASQAVNSEFWRTEANNSGVGGIGHLSELPRS